MSRKLYQEKGGCTRVLFLMPKLFGHRPRVILRRKVLCPCRWIKRLSDEYALPSFNFLLPKKYIPRKDCLQFPPVLQSFTCPVHVYTHVPNCNHSLFTYSSCPSSVCCILISCFFASPKSPPPVTDIYIFFINIFNHTRGDG